MTLDRLAVDSSAAVDYFDPTRHTPPAIDQADQLVLPLPVLGELRFGALNASAEWRPRMLETLDAFVERCEVLLPDLQTADVYARVRASIRFPVTMSRRREVHLLNDVWIAALCIQHELPLLTNDRDFEAIPDLTIIRW
jgi:tRNA(fMet)-specific endonuclease VapC